MLKIHSRAGRKHLHDLWWKNKERNWHHGVAQGNVLKLTYSSGNNICYGKTHDKPLQLDLQRLVQSVNKSISKNTGLLKPIKSVLKRFSSYVDRFKLGWQEDNEKVRIYCCNTDYKLLHFAG